MQICCRDGALSHEMMALDLTTVLSLRLKEMMTNLSNEAWDRSLCPSPGKLSNDLQTFSSLPEKKSLIV